MRRSITTALFYFKECWDLLEDGGLQRDIQMTPVQCLLCQIGADQRSEHWS